jgi:caa(3)-type oxidase subunit IV
LPSRAQHRRAAAHRSRRPLRNGYTSIDLGAQGNLIVTMLIAIIKAALVCTFFMHLLWHKKFNLFLTSVLFLILFLSMATTDRGEYQHVVDEYRASQLAPK